MDKQKNIYAEQYASMPEEISTYVNEVFARLCETNLNMRCRNFISENGISAADMINLFDCKREEYEAISPKQKIVKTIDGLMEINSMFKEEFEKIHSYGIKDIRLSKIKTDYSFLTHPEQEQFVLRYKENNDRLPAFYLLCKYMENTRERNFKIICSRYGFSGRMLNWNEVAETFNITAERARQIIVLKNKLPLEKLPFKTLNNYYSWIERSNVITHENADFQKLKEDEQIPSFNAFACIAYITTTHRIESYRFSNTIVFSKEFDEQLDKTLIKTTLEKYKSERRSENRHIPLNDLAQSVRGNVCDDYIADLKVLVSYLLRKEYDIEIDENENVLLPQNFIDIEKELVSILEEKGQPMSYGDLFCIFKEKYPEHKYTESMQIYPYISTSKKIGIIGNKSICGLRSWEEFHFGSIIDFLKQTLEESDAPLTIEDLQERVKKAFNKESSASSLYSNMLLDETRGFVFFENGYYGVTSKEYDPQYVVKIDKSNNIHSPKRKRTFDEWIAKLRDFVERHHRFPLSSGDGEEESLLHWLRNINFDIIASTPEQKEQLKALCDSYDYPKTSAEYKFKQKMSEYKSFVEKNNAFPTIKTNSVLYSWCKEVERNHKEYTDKRRDYALELFDFLNSCGFYA